MAHIAAGFVTVCYAGEKPRLRLLSVHVDIQFIKEITVDNHKKPMCVGFEIRNLIECAPIFSLQRALLVLDTRKPSLWMVLKKRLSIV